MIGWKAWLSELLASAVWGVVVGLAASILLAASPVATPISFAVVAAADAVASGLALALWVKLQRHVGWGWGMAIGALGGGLLLWLTLIAAWQGDLALPGWFVYLSLAFPAALGTLGFNLRVGGGASLEGPRGR